MNNIKGNFLLFNTNNNNKPVRSWTRTDNINNYSNYSTEELDKRRKYEILKYNNLTTKLTKAQIFSKINTSTRNRRSYKEISINYSNPSSSSNVPGGWDLVVNSQLRSIPLTRMETRRIYSEGSNKNLNNIIINYSSPFKIFDKSLVDVSNAQIYVNTIAAITNDGKSYSSIVSDWFENGSSSIFGKKYTTIDNTNLTDLSDVIFNMIEVDRTYKLYEYENNLGFDITESYNVYINALNLLNIPKIKLTQFGTLNSKTGYLGKYLDQVYFVANRNITYDYSYNTIEGSEEAKLYTFDFNTDVKMEYVI